MEGQRSWENHLQFTSMSSSSDVNDVFNGSQGDMNQQIVVADGLIENQLNALSLHQWIYDPKAPQKYFEFLAGNSNFLGAPTTHILEDIPLLVGGTNAASRDPKIQRELYNLPGKRLDLHSTDSSISMDARHTRPSPHELETNNHDGSVNVKQSEHNVNSLERFNEETPRKKIASPLNQRQNRILQTGTSRRQQVKGEDINLSQIPTGETADAEVLKSKPRCSSKSQRATTTDRQRRLRVAERIKALQDQLPHPKEGSQASVLTDIIDHVKYLQLKLKELSRSRLGSEPTYAPFIFLEGYGHYVLHENMTNEPLEEMMGKLLEADPSLATQLLESRGLYVMPLAWAD